MPPKDVETDLVIQAVVLADSYDDYFQPLTADKPRCLLPMCNTPLIDYTLESLAIAGVHQVFVLCCAHADQIKVYLENSKWANGRSTMKVETLISRETMSVGDALRELDARQVITSDFILISGDVVSNLPIRDTFDAHRRRRETEKNAIMTMIVKEASIHHRTRSQDKNGVFILDSNTRECLYYESLTPYQNKGNASIPIDVLDKRSDLDIRNDLIDCQIDICSFEVLALFTENFDYQDMRKDFVHGVLTSDLLGNTIHCDVVQDGYAARAGTTKAYDSISKDILRRWTFPMVIESNLLPDQQYDVSQGPLYKEPQVYLSRTCSLEGSVAIGAKTVVGDNVTIYDSVIGRRCRIEANSVLDGCYVWDDTVIGPNTKISGSILGHNVQILTGVTIEPGCILASHVTVGPNVSVPNGTKLAAVRSDTESTATLAPDPMIVGQNGTGCIWAAESDDDADEDDSVQMRNKSTEIGFLPTSGWPRTSAYSDSSSEDESEDEEPSSFTNLGSVTADQQNQDVGREIRQTIERAFTDDHEIEIAALELNTLRMASNTNYHQIRQEIIPAILDQIDTESNVVSSANAVLRRWGPLITKMTHSEAEQIDVLQIVQNHCSSSTTKARLFAPCLRVMYQLEVTTEDALTRWYESVDSRDGNDSSKRLRGMAKPFIDWLADAEEESSEAESSSEE